MTRAARGLSNAKCATADAAEGEREEPSEANIAKERMLDSLRRVTFDEFCQLSGPETLSPALAALWHDAHGDWEAAHTAAQSDPSRDGSWAHAYLHRKEGDPDNAGYWYAKARQSMPADTMSLETEREAIARALLAKT